MSVLLQTTEAIAAIKATLADASCQLPRIGVILGSGLGAFANTLSGETVIPYEDIPHFPRAGVEGHAGTLHIGAVGEQQVAVMSGRMHYYEGHSMARVTLPTRVLAGLGVKTVLVTNAAGGINPEFEPGDIMAITDHINLTGDNPLRGPNEDELGPRFPDMSSAYDSSIRETIRAAAKEVGISLKEGVYAGLAGPSYETPAEIRMLRTLGGDAVGMSTVAEVIVAAHAGLKVGGLSVITNLAAGLSDGPLTHDEVKETGERVREGLCKLLTEIITGIGNDC